MLFTGVLYPWNAKFGTLHQHLRQSLPCKHTRSSPCTCGNLESRALLLTLSFCGRDTGYLTSGLPVKYPMHYVPELLMLGLTVAGVLAY